jgi:hypothetical protein
MDVQGWVGFLALLAGVSAEGDSERLEGEKEEGRRVLLT